MKFKKGDRVRLVEPYMYGGRDYTTNPDQIRGLEQGHVGAITQVYNGTTAGTTYVVDWDMDKPSDKGNLPGHINGAHWNGESSIDEVSLDHEMLPVTDEELAEVYRLLGVDA